MTLHAGHMKPIEAIRVVTAPQLLEDWETLRHCQPLELYVMAPYFLPLLIARLREFVEREPQP